jgi:hypothetical protein
LPDPCGLTCQTKKPPLSPKSFTTFPDMASAILFAKSPAEGNRERPLTGLAFGYGLSNDIRDAYIFIANHYEPDDQLFLFGFSRGAYTVRAVTGLLSIALRNS